MQDLLNIFLHVDEHLARIVTDYGPWVYGILFAIIFAETGLVVIPFLPGDSLLFACGALAATDKMNIWLLLVLLAGAAILGDAVNYTIGRWFGLKLFTHSNPRSFKARVLNKKHLDRAHAFYEKHGGKAIILARFVPIARTFVPFVAGAANMTYRQFAVYNVVGGVVWVGSCLAAGYAFGNIPFVKKHFELVVLGIIFVSLLPLAFELIRAKFFPPKLVEAVVESAKAAKEESPTS